MRRGLLLLVTLAGVLLAAPALAQPAEPSPAELRTLADLLRDPAIQSWLQAQAEGTPELAAPAGAGAGEGAMAHQVMAGRVDAIRAFLHELAAAIPTLPDEFARAWTTLATERQEQGGPRVVVLLAVWNRSAPPQRGHASPSFGTRRSAKRASKSRPCSTPRRCRPVSFAPATNWPSRSVSSATTSPENPTGPIEPGSAPKADRISSSVWVEAEVYENEFSFVKVGQAVEIVSQSYPGTTFRGRVAFIYPFLDPKTRTLTKV